ncbi:F-box protein, partial [Mycobacterium tuberculosis]
MPDSVLSCILSFLPTERVVATSILSKRWRYVWTSVDKLDFDNSRHCSRSIKVQRHFAPFVYKVLKLHQGNIRD